MKQDDIIDVDGIFSHGQPIPSTAMIAEIPVISDHLVLSASGVGK